MLRIRLQQGCFDVTMPTEPYGSIGWHGPFEYIGIPPNQRGGHASHRFTFCPHLRLYLWSPWGGWASYCSYPDLRSSTPRMLRIGAYATFGLPIPHIRIPDQGPPQVGGYNYGNQGPTVGPMLRIGMLCISGDEAWE